MLRKLLYFLFFTLLFVSGYLLVQLLLKVDKNDVVNPVDNIYQEVETSIPQYIPKRHKIILGGDVMLGRSVMIATLNSGDMFYPFEKVSPKLNTADLVFVNLESPIVENCPQIEGGYKFCTLPEIAKGLKEAGINVVNIANNHSHNFGTEGFEETKKYLDEMGISWVGDDNYITRKVGNKIFGFVGFDYTVNKPSESDYELIRKARSDCDFLVVGVHWGVEYTMEPTDYQRVWAKKIVDAGADFISGHHPHWVQIHEFIKDKPVYYSLGNLVFDQMWSEETKKGMLVEIDFLDGGLNGINEIPIYIQNIGQPSLVI